MINKEEDDALVNKLQELEEAATKFEKKKLFTFIIRWSLTIALAVYFWEYEWVRWLFSVLIVLGLVNLFLIFRISGSIKDFVRRFIKK